MPKTTLTLRPSCQAPALGMPRCLAVMVARWHHRNPLSAPHLAQPRAARNLSVDASPQAPTTTYLPTVDLQGLSALGVAHRSEMLQSLCSFCMAPALATRRARSRTSRDHLDNMRCAASRCASAISDATRCHSWLCGDCPSRRDARCASAGTHCSPPALDGSTLGHLQHQGTHTQLKSPLPH